MERDGLDWFKNAVMENILTHALTWSATSWQVSIKSRKLNFNSRAHVERDALKTAEPKNTYISTHALTWSATP